MDSMAFSNSQVADCVRVYSSGHSISTCEVSMSLPASPIEPSESLASSSEMGPSGEEERVDGESGGCAGGGNVKNGSSSQRNTSA